MPSLRRWVFRIYFLGMLVLFFYPIPEMPFHAPRQFDKMVHVVLFLGFAVLYRINRWPPVLQVLVVSAAFAGGVELVQGLIRYRSAEVADFVAGMVGAVVGVVLVGAAQAVWPGGQGEQRIGG